VHYLAKAEYFTGTGVGGWLTRTLFTALGAMPVQRQTSRAAQEALDTALGCSPRGRLRHLPEGTRSRDGGWPAARPGRWLALTADCPSSRSASGHRPGAAVDTRWPRRTVPSPSASR
jgi:1-acyl-sn-glycerol-3-phosphate acyltransferase